MASSQIPTPYPTKVDIDFKQLFLTLWSGKWLILAFTFVGSAIGVVVALMLPDIYRSEALLAPNHDQGSGNLSTLAGQYGGLASLAGINLRSPSADKTTLGLETLKSRKFISDFIERHDLLVPLMAADGWRSSSNELTIDQDIYDADSGTWVRSAEPPRMPQPSAQEAYEVFRNDVLRVGQDATTGYVSVAVEHYSPHVARQWVDWLVEDINSEIMRQEVAEAEQAIEYLNQQISATSLADLQNVFFRLIEEQTKTVMLAQVSPEYIFRTIDPAVAAELRATPNRALIAIIGFLLGGLIGTVVVLVRRSLAGN